jgi:hypothetical protein
VKNTISALIDVSIYNRTMVTKNLSLKRFACRAACLAMLTIGAAVCVANDAVIPMITYADGTNATAGGEHSATQFSLSPAPRLSDELSRQQQAQRVRVTTEKSLQAALTRAQVVNLYNTEYVPGNTPPAIGWTGSVAACDPGTISPAWRAAMIARINVFRKLARLLPVTEFNAATDDKDEKTLSASMLYSANNSLSHSIPTTWTCYPSAFAGSTVGALGASAGSASNIGLSSGNGFATPAVINAYMDDGGSGNFVVGHRRWILNPPQVSMTTSSVPASAGGGSGNALWVIGGPTNPLGSSASDGVGWPPSGFVPYQLLPSGSNRWSFSYPGANFSATTVTMTKNGQSVAILGYDSRTNNGYADNTIVWRPNNVAANGADVSYNNPGSDQTYVVTVSGVTNTPSSVFTYNVTVIDPASVPALTISGATNSGVSPLTGVSMCSSGGGATCTVTGSNYSCSIPSGWSGSIHPSHATEYFAARTFSNVTTSTVIDFVSARADDVAGQCALDVDGNGQVRASTDGVLILRRMFGFSGASISAGVADTCARRSGAALETYIDAHAMMDVDASAGAVPVGAMTDGLLILRAMLGLTGSAVTNGVTTRAWDAGPNNIKGFLSGNCAMDLP